MWRRRWRGAGLGAPEGGDCPPSAAGGGHSNWARGLRRPRGHADCEGVQTLPGPPPLRGGDSAAARVIAVFVPSIALASQAAELWPAALGPRVPIRLVPRGCGFRAWVWALSGRRRSGDAWTACDGELLLDAVLRTPPQGSWAAAACRRRRRVSPREEGPGARWLLLFGPGRGTPVSPPLA